MGPSPHLLTTAPVPRPALSPSPSVSALTLTLDSLYRVSVTDGRILTGTFICIDPQGNLVLDRAVELAPGEGEKPRETGLVLVPRRHWVTIERDVGGDPEGANGAYLVD